MPILEKAKPMETQSLSNDCFLPIETHEESSMQDISENVSKVFESFRLAYTYKFVGKNPTPEEYVDLRRGFTWAVRPFSAKVLEKAVERWIDPYQGDKHDPSWPPSPQDFFKLCQAIDPSWRVYTKKKSQPKALVDCIEDSNVKTIKGTFTENLKKHKKLWEV